MELTHRHWVDLVEIRSVPCLFRSNVAMLRRVPAW